MPMSALHEAITRVPPGRWAVGVSGGADSVALLRLLHERGDLHLHIVHLDHQTREGESGQDALFVADLAAELGVGCSIGLRSEVEARITSLAKNLPDRYRRARLAFFERVVERENLQGAILAHHADDQAETIAMRLLRHAGVANLRPIQPASRINGLPILRPLLEIPSADLRAVLRTGNHPWREDASNQSDKYLRNRVRRWLAGRADLRDALIQLGKQSDALRRQLLAHAPRLGAKFKIDALTNIPLAIARQAAAQWLIDRGSPAAQLNMATCNRLVEMASDAASSPRQHFPGGLLVRRRRGEIFAEDAPTRPRSGRADGAP
jgi:tRNA(Ile)-lysidine synthase